MKRHLSTHIGIIYLSVYVLVNVQYTTLRISTIIKNRIISCDSSVEMKGTGRELFLISFAKIHLDTCYIFRKMALAV